MKYWWQSFTEWPIWWIKTSCWLGFGMFRHPAWAVGSLSSGPLGARAVETKSTGGCDWPDRLLPCNQCQLGFLSIKLLHWIQDRILPYVCHNKNRPYQIIIWCLWWKFPEDIIMLHVTLLHLRNQVNVVCMLREETYTDLYKSHSYTYTDILY